MDSKNVNSSPGSVNVISSLGASIQTSSPGCGSFCYSQTNDTSALRFRFFFYDSKNWHEFPESASRQLANSLELGSERCLFQVGKAFYVAEFKEYVQRNIQTDYRRSIGWRDVLRNENYGPSTPFQGCSNLWSKVAREKRRATLLSPLDFNCDEALFVRNKLFNGLGDLSTDYLVSAIHKVQNSERRISMFRDTAQEVAAKRGGNANVCWVWHGTAMEAMESIVTYGFGQLGKPRHGNLYGSGVYFAPESKADISLPYAEKDDSGERTLLLCQAILGSQEQIAAHSEHRLTPSSPDYDTGVDRLKSPKILIVWSPFINSHTIVEYVITVKALGNDDLSCGMESYHGGHVRSLGPH